MGYDECMCMACGVEESGHLSLLFALLFLRFTLLVAALGLHVLIVDSESLVDLCPQSRLVLDAKKWLARAT
jgi:hypothetical protein